VADYGIPIATAKESALSDALIEEFIKEMRVGWFSRLESPKKSIL